VPGVGVRARAGPRQEAEGGVAGLEVVGPGRSRPEEQRVRGSLREGWALRLFAGVIPNRAGGARWGCSEAYANYRLSRRDTAKVPVAPSSAIVSINAHWEIVGIVAAGGGAV